MQGEGAGHFSEIVFARVVKPEINRPDEAGNITSTPQTGGI